MARDPDDVYPPGRGPIIDVTPKRKSDIDFDSDKPLVEQVLQKEESKLDRSDKRPSFFENPTNVRRLLTALFIAFFLGGAVAIGIVFLVKGF